MKVLSALIFGFIIGVWGLYLISTYSNLYVAAGVFLLLWSNNIAIANRQIPNKDKNHPVSI